MRLRHSLFLLLLVLAAAAAPDASAQVGLRETFGDGDNGIVGGIGRGTELQRKIVDLQAYPLARCNDNTPAIFYFRPASRAADADKWLIHLQGGGSCVSGLNCAERWFSVNTNFGARNMTGEGFPAGANDDGIFNDAKGQNPFAHYNQVYVHYCSSDVWGGTAADVVLTGFDFGALARGEQACTQEYTISFLGRRIFDAVIGTLRRDGVPPLVFNIDGGPPRLMPDLDAAGEVVLSGGSAGGGGVINSLDHLQGTLPRAQVVGITDSAFRPPKDGMDLSQTRLCVNQGACTPDAQNRWDFAEGPFAVWGALGGTDASCLNYHAADPHQCADSRHVLTDHVLTPYFVRMDLLDKGAVEDYQNDNIFMAGTPDPYPSTPEHEPLTKREFAEVSRAGILALASPRRAAHETAGFTPGAFAPACGEHDELRDDDGVYKTAVRWRGGKRLGMFAVFEAWRAGRNPAILAAESETDSVCPRD
ncbi:MAG TPA: pectin acetylesterase-family hydrolase [Pyrinomonadaceae bacterium]|nr:pectin acetylesterase-family hydrolase [Pyrinomonadaceae bacterium]